MLVELLQNFEGALKLACDEKLKKLLITLGQAATNILSSIQCTSQRVDVGQHALLTIDHLVTKRVFQPRELHSVRQLHRPDVLRASDVRVRGLPMGAIHAAALGSSELADKTMRSCLTMMEGFSQRRNGFACGKTIESSKSLA